MVVLGVDWAFNGLIDPQAIIDQGYKAVLRYLAPSVDNKNITPSEAAAYLAAGLAIVLVWEHTAAQIAGGAAQGHADGLAAGFEADVLGVPKSVPIYCAADYNAPQSDWPNIAAYLDAFGAATGHPVGIYGDAGLCKQMFDDGHATFIWQTAAWSSGAVLANTNIYQPAAQTIIAGRTVDIDKLLAVNYGQWTGAAPSPPTPVPPPIFSPIQPVINPPLVLKPIVSIATVPNTSGAVLVAADGSIYTVGAFPFHGAADGQPYFIGRQAAEVRAANVLGLPYTIKATSGEFYDFGYLPGFPPLRW